MRKFSLILFTCLLSFKADSYSYYYFDSKKIKLSSDSYYRFIRPQLRNIVQEYFFILKKIHPFEGKLVEFSDKASETYFQWSKDIQQCRPPNCQALLKKIYKDLKTLDTKLLKIRKEGLIGGEAKQASIDSYLVQNMSLSKISNLNYKLLHLIEQSFLPNRFSEIPFQRISGLLNEMVLVAQLNLTTLLDESVKKDFEFLRSQFITKIQSQVLRPNDKKKLIKELESLNIVWNSFHMRVIKGRLKIPRQTQTVIKIMHNRWNSILKILLN